MGTPGGLPRQAQDRLLLSTSMQHSHGLGTVEHRQVPRRRSVKVASLHVDTNLQKRNRHASLLVWVVAAPALRRQAHAGG